MGIQSGPSGRCRSGLRFGYERAREDENRQGESISDRRVLNHSEIVRHGWRLGESFWDSDRSATRYATKERSDFERLMERIRSGVDDVLVVWDIARRERGLAVHMQIRDLCYEVGLNFWLVGGPLFDLRDKKTTCIQAFSLCRPSSRATTSAPTREGWAFPWSGAAVAAYLAVGVT